MDIITICSLLIIPVILFTFNLLFLTRLYFALSIFIIGYLEIANYFFFAEFNTRLNYLFIEYLKYPESVFAMIWASYKYHLMVVIPFLLALSYMFFKFAIFSNSQNQTILKKSLILPFILIILAIGIRSSFDKSTPNQSFYSYSNSTIKNDIVNNSIFSLVYAYQLSLKETLPNYGKVDKNLIANIQTINQREYINNETLLYKQTSNFSKKKKVILLFMESFGASYVGKLGGTPTTPYLDSMFSDGLFCSNMYSSSNRSDRGFEAVLTSLFPIYSDSYLKLTKSQNNFWTVAKSFKNRGYETIFLYGGDSKFDNMKGFALNNGFNKVIDKFDFDSDIKRYTWGVSDEELYKKAEEILNKSSKPIFLVVFTLSSHKPFDYPNNKIELYPKEPKESFANAIKYADFALGGFYQNLRKKDFFKDGLLALMGDHNAHMFGDQKIPVNEYKIPALFISHDIKPKEIKYVTHQIDIAPTLLNFSGNSSYIPAMGNDLTKREKPSSALIFSKGMFAYLKNDSFVLYETNKKPQMYNFQYKNIENNNTIIKEGLNFLYGSYFIYNKQLHKDID